MARVVHAEQTDGPFEHLFYTPSFEGETRQLTVVERIVRVDNSAYACTIILPSVAEAEGLTFTITVASALHIVTISDFNGATFNDSVGWTNRTLTTAEESDTFCSTGSAWTIS